MSNSSAWAGERPFPSEPIYILGSGGQPLSRRRRKRWEAERARRQFANLYTGAMSWLRLGSPRWVEGMRRNKGRVEAEAGTGVAEGVSPAALEAAAVLMEDLRLFERESWAGLSGGRAGLLPFLEQLGEIEEGWKSGDPFGTLEWAIAQEKKGEERPAGKVAMRASRLALPKEDEVVRKVVDPRLPSQKQNGNKMKLARFCCWVG